MTQSSLMAPRDDNGAEFQAAADGANAAISVTGTSAQSAVMNSPMVRIATRVACHVAHGTNPTATSSDPIYPAGVEYKKNTPGEKWAFIKCSGESDGIASVTDQR